MKKKTTMLLMFMLCFVAQQASAFRIKARVPSSSEGNTDYSSLISTVVICGIILYIVLKNWSKAVSTCKCTARKVKEYFRKNTQKGYENLIFLSDDGLFCQQLW